MQDIIWSLVFDESAFFLDELSQECSELVAHAAEFRPPFLFRARDGGRVCQAPMDALRVGRKDRAAFPGVVADGNHIIERLPRELVHGFRTVAGDVRSRFRS